MITQCNGEIDWGGWTEVDYVLAGANFGTLREVSIEVCGRNVDILREDLIVQFHTVHHEGILRLIQCYCHWCSAGLNYVGD